MAGRVTHRNLAQLKTQLCGVDMGCRMENSVEVAAAIGKLQGGGETAKISEEVWAAESEGSGRQGRASLHEGCASS